jgi:hypothetical protein
MKGFFRKAAVPLAAVGALGIAAVVYRVAARPKPRGFEGYVQGSSSPGTPAVLGAVAYPNAHGMYTLATVDVTGEARFCSATKSAITVGDVTAGTILYSDGDLHEQPTSCGAARTIVTLEQLVNRRPNEREGIALARMGPDGTTVAADVTHCTDGKTPDECEAPTELWAGSRDGSGWHKVSDDGGGRWDWIDDNHIVVAGSLDDPYALDVRSGRTLLLENPALWDGWRSRDGSHAVYEVQDESGRRTIVQDLESGKKTTVKYELEGAHDAINVWSPDGTRLVHTATDEDGDATAVEVFDTSGRVVERHAMPEAARDPAAGPVYAGWASANRLWFAWSGHVTFIGLGPGGAAHEVVLPSPHLSEEESWTPRLVTTAERQATRHSEPSLYAEADVPRHADPRLHLSFGLPLGWRVYDCKRCVHEAYVPLRVVNTTHVRDGNIGGTGFELTMATTTDAAPAAERRIIHFWGADTDQRTKPEENRVSITKSYTTIGGIRFRVLVVGFWEDGLIYYIGSANGRTYIFEPDFKERNDPVLRLVLDSIRFES